MSLQGDFSSRWKTGASRAYFIGKKVWKKVGDFVNLKVKIKEV